MRKSKSGFTIVELLVVIVIVGILAGMTLVVYRGTQARARDSQRKTDIANIQKALELYYADNGRYPIPSGTASVINSAWYSSGDTSWNTFASTLTSSNAIDMLPADPTNSPGNPLDANNYGYAYFTGGNCGKTIGQWYLLVYRLEAMTKEKASTGDCETNPLGDSYFTSGSSYARVTR